MMQLCQNLNLIYYSDSKHEQKLETAGLTTQTPSCGYDQEFAVVASPGFKSPANFVMSATSPNIILDFYSRDIVDVGENTITLTSTLKDYNPFSGATTPTV